MSNTCTASMRSVNTAAKANHEKKLSLKDRFIKYVLDNKEYIVGGLSAMNGSIYIPDRSER